MTKSRQDCEFQNPAGFHDAVAECPPSVWFPPGCRAFPPRNGARAFLCPRGRRLRERDAASADSARGCEGA